MNGRKAKALRKKVYGDMAYTRGSESTHHVEWEQVERKSRSGSVHKYWKPKLMVFNWFLDLLKSKTKHNAKADDLRRTYRQLKRAYNCSM